MCVCGQLFVCCAGDCTPPLPNSNHEKDEAEVDFLLLSAVC